MCTNEYGFTSRKELRGSLVVFYNACGKSYLLKIPFSTLLSFLCLLKERRKSQLCHGIAHYFHSTEMTCNNSNSAYTVWFGALGGQRRSLFLSLFSGDFHCTIMQYDIMLIHVSVEVHV